MPNKRAATDYASFLLAKPSEGFRCFRLSPRWPAQAPPSAPCALELWLALPQFCSGRPSVSRVREQQHSALLNKNLGRGASSYWPGPASPGPSLKLGMCSWLICSPFGRVLVAAGAACSQNSHKFCKLQAWTWPARPPQALNYCPMVQAHAAYLSACRTLIWGGGWSGWQLHSAPTEPFKLMTG